MTDTAYQYPDRALVGHSERPYTVLLMIPDEMRGDKCCAADWVRRVWTHGDESEIGIHTMISKAQDECAILFGWADYLTEEELAERKAALEPVAIYSGHVFDIYQP